PVADRMVTLPVFNLSVALASFLLAALVAEHRRTEQEVKRSEERVSGLLASAPGAILVVGEDGCIEVANAQAETMFGYGAGEMVGLSVEALVPQALSTAHRRDRTAYLKDLTARPMGLGLDLAGQRKNGTEFPVEIGLSGFHTPEGRLVTCILTDLTE